MHSSVPFLTFREVQGSLFALLPTAFNVPHTQNGFLVQKLFSLGKRNLSPVAKSSEKATRFTVPI